MIRIKRKRTIFKNVETTRETIACCEKSPYIGGKGRE